jgi:hypothetical protein
MDSLPKGNDNIKMNKLQKGCTRLAAASDKVYQLLAHGRWLSPGTPASSTAKTDRHDIAEILLKVALKQQKSINQSIFYMDSLPKGNDNIKMNSTMTVSEC